MRERIRVLSAHGIAAFGQYLEELRGGSTSSTPLQLLTDHNSSVDFGDAVVERRVFVDRFAFGSYLVHTLSGFDRRSISRNHGLWTWLALYYFDELCPKAADGSRNPLASAAYVLPEKYDFRNYYRHLVRTPWLAVADHGDRARVLLIPAGRNPTARGEIIEQLASRQSVLGNRRLIEAVYQLYFDETKGKPRRGTGGSKGGSPRRLATILQQLDLTFDLTTCDTARLISLLPKEFDRWRQASA